MLLIFLFLFMVGIIAIFCGALPVIGQVVIALIKYVIAPFLAFMMIYGFFKYGV